MIANITGQASVAAVLAQSWVGATLITSGGTSNVLTIPGLVTGSFIGITPKSASAAADIAAGNIYTSAQSGNTATIVHSATSGENFYVFGTVGPGVQLTTSGTTTDTVTIPDLLPQSFIVVSPANASAALDIAAGNVYISAQSPNSVTITHGNTAGEVFNVFGAWSTLGSLVTTSGATFDTLSLPGLTSGQFVAITPLNASAALDIAAGNVYISAQNPNTLTLTHGTTSGEMFYVSASPSFMLQSVINGQATVAGTIASVGVLVSSILGQASVTGSLQGGIAAAVLGRASVSGTMAGAGVLASSVTGVATVLGTMGGAGVLVGSATGQATVSGTIAGAGILAAPILGQAAVSGAISGGTALVSSITGQATVVGNLNAPQQLLALILGQASVSGNAEADGFVVSSILGSASVSGAVSGSTSLVSSITGQAAVSGTAVGLINIIASATGQASVLGTISPTILIAFIQGQASVFATPSAPGALTVSILGQASVTGTILGAFVITPAIWASPFTNLLDIVRDVNYPDLIRSGAAVTAKVLIIKNATAWLISPTETLVISEQWMTSMVTRYEMEPTEFAAIWNAAPQFPPTYQPTFITNP